MDHGAIRQKLMDSVMKVVALSGLENVTTKQISIMSNYNEAYIYRYFIDRDDLFKKTFLREDERMIRMFANSFSIFTDATKNLDERVRVLFDIYIDYLKSNVNACLFYTRYYFSTFFMKDAYQEHLENFKIIYDLAVDIFIEGTDIYTVIHHIFDTLLNNTIKIYNGEIPDNEASYNEVFNLLYQGIEKAIKPEYKMSSIVESGK